MVARARAAQPALGGDRLRGPRAGAAPRPEVGDSTTRTGSSARSSSETGKAYEDALLAEVGYAAIALGFWAKHAAALPRRRAGPQRQPVRARAAGSCVRYRPLGVVGVIGPWNYPLVNSLRRRHPGAGGRQRRRAQAVGGDAAHLAADGRVPARVRAARGRLPGRHGRRRHRRRAGRRTSTWSCSRAPRRPAEASWGARRSR